LCTILEKATNYAVHRGGERGCGGLPRGGLRTTAPPKARVGDIGKRSDYVTLKKVSMERVEHASNPLP